MKRQVRLRRVYDDPAPDDGARVLVDRIWPRGLTKAAVHLDEWVKDNSPRPGTGPVIKVTRWGSPRPRARRRSNACRLSVAGRRDEVLD